MRLWRLSVVSRVGVTLLYGCNPVSAASPFMQGGRGTYASVGIYSPGRQWTELMANQQAKGPAEARSVDDQVIIVVQNSATGEGRACGDLTRHKARDEQGGASEPVVKPDKASRSGAPPSTAIRTSG